MNIINFAILHLHWKWHFNIRFVRKALSRLPKPFSSQPTFIQDKGDSVSLTSDTAVSFYSIRCPALLGSWEKLSTAVRDCRDVT